MQFANYFFASIISFLGLLIGILLVKIAPEEQNPYRRYFSLLKRILLLMIFAFLIFFYLDKWLYIVSLAAYFLFLLFIEHSKIDLLKKSMITYSALGVLFYLSYKNTNLFAIESSLILFYGLPDASLLYRKKEKNHYKIIFYNLGFVIISNLLYFI